MITKTQAQEDINLAECTDASVWAREFVKMHGFGDKSDLLRAWFANAIAAGYAEGYKSGYKEAQDDYEVPASPGGTD